MDANGYQLVAVAPRMEKRDDAEEQCCRWTKGCADFLVDTDEKYNGDLQEQNEDWEKVWCCIDMYLFSCPSPPKRTPLCYGPPPTCYNNSCPEGGKGTVA